MRILLGIIFTFLALLMANCRDRPYKLSTTSPNRTYTVNLIERIDPPEEPSIRYIIDFKLLQGEREIANVPRFSAASSSYERFGKEYPDSKWVADNILCLYKKAALDKQQPDMLFVMNDSEKVISYLMLETPFEMFLLIGLQPGAKLSIDVQAQTEQWADISWVGYSGRFFDGGRIKPGGANFRIKGQYKAPARYCFNVGNAEAIIRSHDFEGFNILQGKESIFPRAPDCGR